MHTFNITMAARFLQYCNTSKQFAWEVTLTRDSKTLVTPYFAGVAHCTRVDYPRKGGEVRITQDIARALQPFGRLTISDCEGYVSPTPPDLASMLACLQSDARAGEHCTYEDFADEFGTDPDSRSGERTWRKCQNMRSKVQKLLGSSFDEFMCAEFES